MQGLELAKRYYEEVGRPMLEREFPELLSGQVLTSGFRRKIITSTEMRFRMLMTVCQGSLQVFRHASQVRGAADVSVCLR